MEPTNTASLVTGCFIPPGGSIVSLSPHFFTATTTTTPSKLAPFPFNVTCNTKKLWCHWRRHSGNEEQEQEAKESQQKEASY
eukprot:scaffold1680_cov79-Cylindrotheca_fusiformis.AAC.7